jgi:hypothetical protein
MCAYKGFKFGDLPYFSAVKNALIQGNGGFLFPRCSPI